MLRCDVHQVLLQPCANSFALKTIKDKNYKPIRLCIGKLKKFDGVEFSAKGTAPYDYIIDWYDTWLFIKCDPKYVDYLNKEFIGENFKIYGEKCGSNFRIMGKVNTKKIYKNPKAKIINL